MGKRKRTRQPAMWVATTDLPTAAFRRDFLARVLVTRCPHRVLQMNTMGHADGGAFGHVNDLEAVLRGALEKQSVDVFIGEQVPLSKQAAQR